MTTRASIAAALLLASSGLAMGRPQSLATGPETATAPTPATATATATAQEPAKPAPKEASKPEKDKKKLKVGDTAPALSIDSWVKGDAVGSFEKGRVYVVEFWATWCIPCKASMPHLTQMQKKHKELTVICVAGSERLKKNAPDERLSNLEKFVKARSAEMGFRVAYDAKHVMTADWMEASGQRGIPCGFVVDGEGKIAFIGYPMDKGFERAFVDALKKTQSMAKPTATASVTGSDAPHAALPTVAVSLTDAPQESGAAGESDSKPTSPTGI